MGKPATVAMMHNAINYSVGEATFMITMVDLLIITSWFNPPFFLPGWAWPRKHYVTVYPNHVFIITVYRVSKM